MDFVYWDDSSSLRNVFTNSKGFNNVCTNTVQIAPLNAKRLYSLTVNGLEFFMTGNFPTPPNNGSQARYLGDNSTTFCVISAISGIVYINLLILLLLLSIVFFDGDNKMFVSSSKSGTANSGRTELGNNSNGSCRSLSIISSVIMISSSLLPTFFSWSSSFLQWCMQ